MKLLSKYLDQTYLNQYHNACLRWGRCTVTNSYRLIKLQKRAMLIALNADFKTPSQTMFNENNVQRIKMVRFPKRVQYHTCIMMFKALHGLAPEYIRNLFNKIPDFHTRNLRSIENEMLRIPESRTSYYYRSFAVRGAREWNALPFNVKNSESFASFKNTLKSYLLTM